MKTNNLPLDLVMFMREYGILEEITLPEKQGSDKLPKYEVSANLLDALLSFSQPTRRSTPGSLCFGVGKTSK